MHFIGYEADTSSMVKPMFCLECGDDVNREVNGLTTKDMTGFDSASCVMCGETFYELEQ